MGPVVTSFACHLEAQLTAAEYLPSRRIRSYLTNFELNKDQFTPASSPHLCTISTPCYVPPFSYSQAAEYDRYAAAWAVSRRTMAPLRRYLRITKYSVLECRIYLDNPALAQSWLLNPRDPVLPRVIESVRPLVLPKLREERERSRKKSTKKRGIKDTVTEGACSSSSSPKQLLTCFGTCPPPWRSPGTLLLTGVRGGGTDDASKCQVRLTDPGGLDDFEVSIFLTETSTRHSMLYKHKHFRDTTQTKLTSNSSKLIGASRDAPVDVEGGTNKASPPILREEDDDDELALQDIPTREKEQEIATAVQPRPSKRRRGSGTPLPSGDHDCPQDSTDNTKISDDDVLFVSQDEDESEDDDTRPPQAKRRREETSATEHETRRDDKKKLAMDISYEGFSIYGRVLCLVVRRRGDCVGNRGKGTAAAGSQQATMENWITSTQMPEEAVANGLLEAT